MPTFKHPCPACGKYIARDVARCPFCGAIDPFVPGRCQACRAPIEDLAWVACPTCGAPLKEGVAPMPAAAPPTAVTAAPAAGRAALRPAAAGALPRRRPPAPAPADRASVAPAPPLRRVRRRARARGSLLHGLRHAGRLSTFAPSRRDSPPSAGASDALVITRCRTLALLRK